MMRVLIALDAGAQCGEMVKAVARRPWPAGTKFLLLHVLDPFPFAKAPISLQRAQDAAEAQLQNLCSDLSSPEREVKREVVLGHPRREITRIAKTWNSNLIVVGSNETTAVTRLLLGSTAQAVLRHAPCAVEIVRPVQKQVETGGMKILVATDGSECSTAALRSVASRPWPAGTVVKVLSLPEPTVPLTGFPYVDLREIQHQNEAALEDAKAYVAAGVEVLTQGGLKASGETPLPTESDGREIVEEAKRWQADLIVVGSHGRRGFDRLTMGSVSEYVALHAPCSVEVIRKPQEVQADAKAA